MEKLLLVNGETPFASTRAHCNGFVQPACVYFLFCSFLCAGLNNLPHALKPYHFGSEDADHMWQYDAVNVANRYENRCVMRYLCYTF